jgi:hypothetical protein
MEDIIYSELKNEITPSPVLEPTVEEYNNIKILIESGLYPRDIFIMYNYPLEWAVKVENDLRVIEEPVINEEII